MDQKFMQRAIELARKGIGHTSPNPTVGAVIVKDGKIIGEGWHRRSGADHAEVVACKSVQRKEEIQGATFYTTLEPCSHFGKTPPCVDIIQKYKIKRVVAGMKDPFRRVNGKGISQLRKQGITVELVSKKHPISKSIYALNQGYMKWVQTGLPYVTLKAGQSLDGRICSRTGKSQWITSTQARRDARLERSLADAALVGAGTVIADNPSLAPYGRWSKKKLHRIIIDGKLRCNPESKVFRDNNVIVVCTTDCSESRRRSFEKKGIRVEAMGRKRVSIKKLIQFLGKEYFHHIFVEGGADVHGSFYDEAIIDPLIVDQILFYIAPKIIGGTDSLGVVGGVGVGDLEESMSFKDMKVSMIKDNIKVRGIINTY